ncbi:MAG TPA: sigma-70 family RNA polymerase sigma factor [Pirellulales bacterium]|nr:sigma-70 family RNA polymerase sigma factor [Pirellulales bacterium]
MDHCDTFQNSRTANQPGSTDDSAEFAALMDQVRQGSQEAAEKLWREYGPCVIHVVRRALNQNLRSQLDSQDFSQDVWASFFRELPDAGKVSTPTELLHFLTRMARNKVFDGHRRLHAHRRSVELEVSHGVFLDGDERIDEREPTPSQVVAANVLIDEMTLGQPPEARRVVQMRRDGLTEAEIAAREQMSTRSVRRIITHIKRLFFHRWSP